jgi:outer membrane protein OmpA-like peptidoglycan-associated protein
MTQPFIENNEINPNELQDILINFLGQTYGEVSRYDSNLLQTNQFLSPKKYEFQKTAEMVLQNILPQQPQQLQQLHQLQQLQQPQQRQYIPQFVPEVQPQPDPNQLEFNFNDSVTAKTIYNKLEELEKRIKNIDKSLSSVISLLQTYEVEDTQ